MAKAQNLFETAKLELDSIAQILETCYFDKKKFHKAVNLLKKPQNQLNKKLILKLANGKKATFDSSRIQYNDANGPFMGGLRFSKNINVDQIKSFALYESLKSSLANIPFGGSFGGINLDFQKISTKDIQRITKIYSQFLTPHIGPWKDILTTEKGTDEKNTCWMMEAYERKKRLHSPATFVSNRLGLDGATIVLHEYIKSVNYSSVFRKIDVAIHGFGKRGYLFAKNLNIKSYRIVAISDSSGGIVNSSGFDVEEIKKLKDKFGSLKEVSVMQKIEFIANVDLLKLPVDILAISSAEQLVTKDIANNISAKIVLELVDFGVTKEAKETINDNKIVLLPDLILNSGFSVLHHFEWVQKMHGYRWSREEVLKKLHITMTKIFKEVKELSDEKKISYKEACLYLGVKRIIYSMIERGRV